jgi:hypothetical protein
MGVSAPHSWNNLTNKPNTVAGFGISDMATQTVANATNATNATAVPFSGVTGKPTTLTGYGITDEKCKAWVNFNGTGVVAIRASFNVSSITDNAVGNYTVNFTVAMPDANYAVASIGAQSQRNNFAVTYAAASFRIATENYAVTSFDEAVMSLSVFR